MDVREGLITGQKPGGYTGGLHYVLQACDMNATLQKVPYSRVFFTPGFFSTWM
jgi:hypothetical protein